MADAADFEFMAQALRLAERGLYTTTPNPRVGCVIVSDGAVVGSGWHRAAGGPHAEVEALAAAGSRARGATAYVTLEPCNHHGRTPPCSEALLAAGVARVVAAMRDPNPAVAGKGLEKLSAAGIAVEAGVLESEARELNVGFVSRTTRGRPWLRVKIAAGLDGKTALENGTSQWITSAEARRDAHHWRARSCAIMTGIGTLNDDDPRLTVRDVETPRQPLRIVVDSRLRVPANARIFDGGAVLVVSAVEQRDKIAQIRERGGDVVVLPDGQGKVDLAQLAAELGRRGLNEVMTEAGINLHSALLRAGVIDELLLYLAPALLGDRARGMFDLGDLTEMGQTLKLSLREVRQVGPDLRLRAQLEGRA
jgi:diaminohydroxyphosphoribosylaminopyrimidine deaminase / 5-amino-6-(5-phosphoribosylamino)uracil reductase